MAAEPQCIIEGSKLLHHRSSLESRLCCAWSVWSAELQHQVMLFRIPPCESPGTCHTERQMAVPDAGGGVQLAALHAGKGQTS